MIHKKLTDYRHWLFSVIKGLIPKPGESRDTSRDASQDASPLRSAQQPPPRAHPTRFLEI